MTARIPHSATPLNEPKRWPMVQPLETRSNNLLPIRGAALFNGYAEYDETIHQYWVYKRPGLSATPRYACTGTITMGVFSDNKGPNWVIPPWSVVDNILFRGPTAITGALPHTGLVLGYSFSVVPTVDRLMVFGNNNNLFTYNYNTTAVFQVVDPDLPSQFCPGIVYLDGTTYLMKPNGEIRGSDIDDPTSWDPLNSIVAGAYPDDGVYLARQGSYIIALKSTSLQVFYDAGNPPPGSPLSPVPDAMVQVGCFAPYSVVNVDNTLIWLAVDNARALQIAQMDGLAHKIVSTPSVERLIQNAIEIPGSGRYGIWGSVLKQNGHRFYVLAIGGLNLTLVYDIDQTMWYVWTDVNGDMWPIRGIVGNQVNGQATIQSVAQLTTLPGLYTIDPENVLDIGQLIPVDIYTANYDGDIDRKKTLNMLHFDADQVAGSVLQSRWNDNDFADDGWSNFREIDLSRERPVLPNNGTFRRRAYNWRHNCPTKLRIKSVDLQMDLGTL